MKNLCHFEMGGLANADVIRGGHSMLTVADKGEGVKFAKILLTSYVNALIQRYRTKVHSRGRPRREWFRKFGQGILADVLCKRPLTANEKFGMLPYMPFLRDLPYILWYIWDDYMKTNRMKSYQEGLFRRYLKIWASGLIETHYYL